MIQVDILPALQFPVGSVIPGVSQYRPAIQGKHSLSIIRPVILEKVPRGHATQSDPVPVNIYNVQLVNNAGEITPEL